MNWKKALLVVLLGGFTLVFFVVATVGFLATTAVTTAAVAISESGVVEVFEEVAGGAEHLQVNVDGQSITFTDVDIGESRVIIPDTTRFETECRVPGRLAQLFRTILERRPSPCPFPGC
jgi:hypothetical protein